MLVLFFSFTQNHQSVLNTLRADGRKQFIMEYILQISLINKQI